VALVERTPGAALAPDGVIRWPTGRQEAPLLKLASALSALEQLLLEKAGSENL
jgi:hypothetical protein